MLLLFFKFAFAQPIYMGFSKNVYPFRNTFSLNVFKIFIYKIHTINRYNTLAIAKGTYIISKFKSWQVAHQPFFKFIISNFSIEFGN